MSARTPEARYRHCTLRNRCRTGLALSITSVLAHSTLSSQLTIPCETTAMMGRTARIKPPVSGLRFRLRDRRRSDARRRRSRWARVAVRAVQQGPRGVRRGRLDTPDNARLSAVTSLSAQVSPLHAAELLMVPGVGGSLAVCTPVCSISAFVTQVSLQRE